MADTVAMLHKEELRREMRAGRNAISPAERDDRDRKINRILVEFSVQSGLGSLSAFWPFDGEPDVRPALEALHDKGTTIALPVLNPDSGITLHHWTPHTVMAANSFGIAEPVDENKYAARELDVLLIPLVAWDREGGRLGMGGGHYDRLLEMTAGLDVPLRLGVAYGLQEAPEVPLEEHDVRLHGLLCEHGWMMFES